MKHIYWILLCCIVLGMGCADRTRQYVIEGSLPSTQYDGEWIYLVPMENAPGRVDSVCIHEGTFRFTGNGEEMRVLRMRYALRLQLQELLVVTEPGYIQVKVDSIGSVTGTPQNDAMQRWKEGRERHIGDVRQVYQELRRTSADDEMVWTARRDSLAEAERNRNFEFLKAQGQNTLGVFFKKMIGGSLTQEQQKQLDEEQ